MIELVSRSGGRWILRRPFLAEELVCPFGKFDIRQREVGQTEILGIEFRQLEFGSVKVVPPIFESLAEALLQIVDRPGKFADMFER